MKLRPAPLLDQIRRSHGSSIPLTLIAVARFT